MEQRKYLRLDLPGETVILDVPAVAPVKAKSQIFSVEPCQGYPVNMVYDDGKTPIIWHKEDS
jgi:hypothetical protein